MKKITAILALLLVQNSYALELEGVNGVEILAIDGQKMSRSLFSESAKDLTAGEHQIVVRYAKLSNKDERVESRPAIFTLDLQQDTTISVKRMNSARHAKQQIKAGLTWQVSSEDKQYEIKDSDILMDEGFMPYSDIEKLIGAYNQEQNIILAGATVATTAAVVATKSASLSEPQLQGENDLITLYQQSTKEQKKSFRLWLLEQDMK